MLPEQFSLSSYNFDLDPARIAQNPASSRIDSKLLNGLNNSLQDCQFSQLPSLMQTIFPKGVLFVTNNTEVLRARLMGKKSSGGKVEALLFESKEDLLWKGLLSQEGVCI